MKEMLMTGFNKEYVLELRRATATDAIIALFFFFSVMISISSIPCNKRERF